MRHFIAPACVLALLAMLLGCTDARVPVGSPHEFNAGFFLKGGAAFHGASSLDCAECHDRARFCSTCHFGPGGSRTPAGSSYAHGTIPHNSTALQAVGAVCDACHATAAFYSGAPRTCHPCHAAPPRPHPFGEAWLSSASPAFHGSPQALNLGRCAGCHDLDKFCSTCHFGREGSRSPEGSGWTHARNSHTQDALVAAGSVCVNCHRAMRAFGDGPRNATCAGCHDGAFSMHARPFGDAHRAGAKADLKACQLCHGKPGTNFEGGVAKVACSECHPAAKAHPTDWQGEGSFSHRSSGNLTTACVLCHDVFKDRVKPLADAPSCYSANFTNGDGQARSCHAQGWMPHAAAFSNPADHGPIAKADLVFCQECHGTPGTTAFTGGPTGLSCADCHAAAGAHPTDWQGSGTYSHRTAGNHGTACAICHDVTQGRTPPNPTAPSCFSANFTNADGAGRACHVGGPGVPHALAAQFRQPAAHGPEAKKNLKYCQSCHGQPGTVNFSGGKAKACADCHLEAKAHPADWQGGGSYSHQSSGDLTASCAICHKVDAAGVGPFPGAPSCFTSLFTNPAGQTRECHPGGPGIPHAVPAQFRLATAHGPEAKKNLLYCQTCHGQPGTVSFSGGKAKACADCHLDAKAHPTDWQGSGTYSHRSSQAMETACARCHDYTKGRVPPVPGAPSCYSANFTNAAGQARICHADGPVAHPLGQPWLDKKVATYHGKSTRDCASCHAVSTFCSTCHFGPTGSKVPSGVSWTHGFSGHKGLSSYQTVCTACHNVNRRYGNQPGQCHDCHED